VSRAVGETAVSDFLGYLLVAKGRLTRDDLTDISQEDALNGIVFERTIKQLQRYVIGDEKDGYIFCHPRFRDYVAQERIKEREQQPYRQCLLDYCARWPEHKSKYAFIYYAHHLADAERYKDLIDLLTPEWIFTKWNVIGSYSALNQDLYVAAITALEQEPPDYVNVVALAIARQTAYELMLNLPTSLLAAWVRLGEIERVLELVGVPDTVRERTSEAPTTALKELLKLKKSSVISNEKVDPASGTVSKYASGALTTVAKEMLELKKLGVTNSENKDLAKIAVELLGQSASLLSFERSSSSQLKALSSITGLLGAESELTETQRTDLTQQVWAFAQGLPEPALQASALGLVAEVLVTSEPTFAQAHQLVEQVQMTIKKIDFRPDLLVATAYLLPTLQKLDPNAVLPAIRSTYKAGDPFEASSLGKNPLVLLLEKWDSKMAPDQAEAILLLQEIGELCVNREEMLIGFTIGHVAVLLCELGQGQAAIDLIQKLWERSPIEGARAVNEAVHSLHRFDPANTISWLDRAQEFTDASHHDIFINRELFTSKLASNFAYIGNWDSAIDLLETVRPRERVEGISECLTLIGMDVREDSAELRSTANKLIELSRDADTDEQAEVYAVAAQALVVHDPALAKEYLNHAVGICLADLPEDRLELLHHARREALVDEGAQLAMARLALVDQADLRRIGGAYAVGGREEVLPLRDVLDVPVPGHDPEVVLLGPVDRVVRAQPAEALAHARLVPVGRVQVGDVDVGHGRLLHSAGDRAGGVKSLSAISTRRRVCRARTGSASRSVPFRCW